MGKGISSCQGVVFAALSASCLLAAEARPAPLPTEVVQAWEKAGARVGWLGNHPGGYLAFESEPEGLADVTPAFQITVWRPGMLGKLAAPKLMAPK